MANRMTDADVLAEVTDAEIEALLKARTARQNAVAMLREKLDRAELELFTTETAIAEWIADTRKAFGFEPAAERPATESNYAAGYSHAAGYPD